MKSTTQVIVIGGGIIGCSILYHLSKLGLTDCMLLERSELTSGSTWHAAAGFGVLHDNTFMAQLNYYSIECYRKLEAETGQSCGIHTTGGLYLAQDPKRFDQLKIMEAKAGTLGFDFEFIPTEKINDYHPLLNTQNLLGAWFQPDEGHLDPSGVTQAFARGARQAGAEVVRFCAVLETNQRADGSWDVVTEQGTVNAEMVVNAAGLWAREVAQLAGLALPLVAMEHQYFVTDEIPDVAQSGRELPSVSDRDAEYYMRQEGLGLLVGAYERHGKHWSIDATPLDFGHELLPDDLDRISENLTRAIARIPALGRAGVKRVVNGPMMWSPDTLGLLGPVPGLKNYYSATGIMTGIAQGGGLGKTLAEWIVNKEPVDDLSALDIARFGNFYTQEHLLARSAENYGTRFRMHFPYEVQESGRPLRAREHYARQKQQGGVFGVSFGWENPLYFARNAAQRDPGFSYRRAKWFDVVAEECRHLRTQGAIIDTSAYAKFQIHGRQAERWLDTMITNHLPENIGDIVLAPMLNRHGRLAADFTLTRLARDAFLLIGSGGARVFHQRWFESNRPRAGVAIDDVSDTLVGFSVSGPRIDDFMGCLLGGEDNVQPLRFMRHNTSRCNGVDAQVLGVSYTGERGFEVYLPAAGFAQQYQRICELAAATQIGFAGTLAQNALRLEKAYGSWFSEYSNDYDPNEAGLGAFVKLEKPDFIGRDALLARRDTRCARRLCCFEIDAEDDAFGSEPVLCDGRVVGELTSGAYGHAVNKSLALGYIKPSHIDAQYEIPIVGQWRQAKRLAQAPYDPQGHRLRASSDQP